MSEWSKHHNPDRTLSIYRDGKFVAAIENTTASCDLFYQFSTEIKRLEDENKALYDSRKEIMRDCDRMSKSYDFDQAQITKLKRANEIAVKALEAIATSSQKDEFLSDVEYRHRISGIYFSSEKALSEIKGIL